MNKQRVLREINAIYENCKAYMKDVSGGLAKGL